MSTIRPTSSWIKASKSGNQGQCVEMRRHDGAVEIRDTKDAGLGPTLRLTTHKFEDLLNSAKAGAFDHLM